jgi:hypothetical protein
MKNKRKTMSKGITIVIPVHKLDKSTEALFVECLKSVKNQKTAPEGVMVVVPTDSGLMEKSFKLAKKVGLEITVTENDGSTDFCSQLNKGVDEVTTSHFMLLEFDDTLTEIWVDNAKTYMEAYDKVDVFLPIIMNHNKDGEALGFTNEPVWANEFSDKLGELDTETLLRYNDFNFDGMVMSVEKYKECGGLKSSMKMTFILEFLLRVTELKYGVMVIPKLGYNHYLLRDESLLSEVRENMSIDEQRWWLSLAKKEYFHTKDRGITYEKEG